MGYIFCAFDQEDKTGGGVLVNTIQSSEDYDGVLNKITKSMGRLLSGPYAQLALCITKPKFL